MTTDEEIRELGGRWAAAEERGDTGVLGELAVDGFRLVGPLGFVLDKRQWLERYRSGDLVTEKLAWADVEVRDLGADRDRDRRTRPGRVLPGAPGERPVPRHACPSA